MLKTTINYLLYTTIGRIITLITVIIVGLLLWLAWWLASPLWIDMAVDEEFPLTANAVIPQNMEREEAETIMLEAAQQEDILINEAMPAAEMQPTDNNNVVTTPLASPTVAPTALPNATPTPTPTNTPEPEPEPTTSPILLKNGTFKDADRFHKGSGDAKLYQLPDGKKILRLEEFQVTNGPRLHVYLSAHPDPMSSGAIHADLYEDLGGLKGNKGNQNYELADHIDVSEYNSVVIYCVPFRVIFSVATIN